MQDNDSRFWLTAQRSVTRRQLLRGGAVAGMGLAAAALIGCGDDDDEAPAATAAPAAATAAPAATTAAAAATAAATPEVMQPKRGGTLRIAGQLAGDVPSLDYHRTNGSAMGSIANNVGAKLVQWDERPDSDAPAEAVLPDLATSWEQTPDGLNWTFNLRDDAQTSDGRVVLAEDVIWSFRRASFMRDPAGLLPRFTAEMFTDREPNAEAVDDYTVKTTLTAPDADYLSIMGSHWWTVETKEAITRNGTELGEKGFGDIVSVEQMRGAGPFYPTEYVPASGFKLARNPNYHTPELPYVDELDHPLILDPTAAAAALQAGELDAFGPLISFPINQAFEMEKIDSLNVEWFPAMVWNPWVFDLTVAPFNDVRVRRALALAIDRPTWIEELYSGRGRNAVMVLPWLSFWYLPPEEMGDAGRYYTGWDPDEAKKLLMAAGAEDASYTVQAANIGSYTITYPNIDLVASMVAEVGLKQNLNIVDYGAHRRADVPRRRDLPELDCASGYPVVRVLLGPLRARTLGRKVHLPGGVRQRARVPRGGGHHGEAARDPRQRGAARAGARSPAPLGPGRLELVLAAPGQPDRLKHEGARLQPHAGLERRRLEVRLEGIAVLRAGIPRECSPGRHRCGRRVIPPAARM